MKNGITLDLSQFLASVSLALDAVESEVLGAVQNHARRVAYLSVSLGKALGLGNGALSDLAAYAALHDNALTEYITLQRRLGNTRHLSEIRDDIAYHCEAGEKNLAVFTFMEPMENVVLYHHENMDGSGLFGIRGEHIPLMARILRLADQLDVSFVLSSLTAEKRGRIERHLREHGGTLYDGALVSPVLSILAGEETAVALADENIVKSLNVLLPSRIVSFTYEQFSTLSSILAHIIDYKSPFTLSHSTGIAEKTLSMAQYYALDERTLHEVHIAAYLHDIGKLAVPDALLEKPAKLTPQEYKIVQGHALATYEILSAVDSLHTVAQWASGHHERLDGSGYFRGSTGGQQDFCTRLLECIDVYQALVEDRPYRAGMEPEAALSLMRGQVDHGKLDGQIIGDIAKVLVH